MSSHVPGRPQPLARPCSAEILVALCLLQGGCSSGDPSVTQATASPGAALIPADRTTVWSPGIPGGVPSRTRACATVSASTYGDGASDASAGIQSALNACPAGLVVQLSAGTFLINDSYLLMSGGVTLRGAGPGVTTLKRTNGAKPGDYKPAVRDPIVIVGPSRWNGPNDGTSQDLTVDGVKGSSSVTVANGGPTSTPGTAAPGRPTTPPAAP